MPTAQSCPPVPFGYVPSGCQWTPPDCVSVTVTPVFRPVAKSFSGPADGPELSMPSVYVVTFGWSGGLFLAGSLLYTRSL